jgi:hypothetical protein
MGAKRGPPALRGKISATGKLTVAEDVPSQAGIAVAKANGLTAPARVRVACTLPYKQNFAKVPVGAIPGGWVNCGGKFVVVEIKDAKVLKKTNNNPNPLLARARTYICMPTRADYTIQADVMGSVKNNEMPDVGVTAKRYALFLDGNKQILRLTSWSALPRVDETVKFPWKSDVWYRMKLSVTSKGDEALVRGKVWPAADEEPKAWTIEFTDPAPNPAGSPALYGYSTAILDAKEGGSEAFFANVSITPHKTNKKAKK